MSVTTPVAIISPYSSGSCNSWASDILATVPIAESATFTRLFPIMIVIKSRSISDFTISNDFAPNRFSRINHCMVCFEVLRKAISVPEKNAESISSIRNKSTENGSTKEKLMIMVPPTGSDFRTFVENAEATLKEYRKNELKFKKKIVLIGEEESDCRYVYLVE